MDKRKGGTGKARGWEGENCTTVRNLCAKNEDDCDPLHATCSHLGPGRHGCTCHNGWKGNGTVCVDIDECLQNQCGKRYDPVLAYKVSQGKNCIESRCGTSAFPKGTKCPSTIKLYNGTTIARPKDTQHVCLDTNECKSNPCKNGAKCTGERYAGRVAGAPDTRAPVHSHCALPLSHVHHDNITCVRASMQLISLYYTLH